MDYCLVYCYYLVAVIKHLNSGSFGLDPRVQTVLQNLSQNLGVPLSVGKLADEVSLSASRLATLFKEQIGDSRWSTLLKMRLQQSSRLMEFTDRSIGEIALSVGFQSPFKFSRQFKEYYSISPSDYRKQLQNRI